VLDKPYAARSSPFPRSLLTITIITIITKTSSN
jgi:hypothetical protein